ncbi:cation efflux protein [Schizophyllum commune]
MGLSRPARIILLLTIDVVFFFVELIVGYAVGSLALVADSFHMLKYALCLRSDVLSLVVALYAIKLSSAKESDSRYSYGWHRAEILAALINGVFLLALCLSIFLEAIERFFSTPEISNAKLVVIVGSLGLASNIVGLFLFHEHGHSHSHAHSHDSATPSVPGSSTPSVNTINESGNITPTPKKPTENRRSRSRTRNSEGMRSRTTSISSMYGHPAATRATLIQTAQDLATAARSPSPSGRRRSRSRPVIHDHHHDGHESENESGGETVADPTERSPLLGRATEDDSDSAQGHAHSHGHAHGSMNMHALLLHVLGDALGNVGVIATGLIIWLTEWHFKYYFDPIISLVITVIIFSSALPLVRSTSFILLQGVPATVSLEEVRAAILDVDGVLSLHELHVWQLSETKLVASVHVTASRNRDFMPIAAQIRAALHERGIHSSTIQPEYYNPRTAPPEDYLKTHEETSCLIMCPQDQGCDPHENACCPPPTSSA